MSKLPIPTDWNQQQDGYVCVWFCAPNSTMWRAIARGAVYNLTKGRGWDERTGTISTAQVVAQEMYGSLCMANCDDIITNLNLATTAIQNLQISMDGINTTLGQIRDRLDTTNLHTDEIEEILDSVNVILGGTAINPTP